MKFKTFYITEQIYSKSIQTLQDIISAISEKDVPTPEKVDKGITFFMTIGAWSNFKSLLSEKLLENKWKNFSKESNSLNFKNKELSLFVEYDGKVVTFFLTDDLKYIPGEEEP